MIGTVISILILFVVIGIAYWIIKTLIMPAIPAPLQVVAWAIIGILLLIALLSLIAYGGPAVGLTIPHVNLRN